MAHRGDRHRRMDRHPAARDLRGGGDREGRGRSRVPRRRPRHPGRRRAGLRAQPVDRGRDARRGDPRLRDERRTTAAATRVPAPARRAGLVWDDEREVARPDHRGARSLRRVPDGGLPRPAAARGRGRAGDPHEPSVAARAAGVPGLPDAATLRRCREARAQRTCLVGMGADRAGRGEFGRRQDLGRRRARRASVALRVGALDVRVERRPARRVRAVLPRHGRHGQHPAARATVEPAAASRTTWSSACRSRFARPPSVRAERGAHRSSGRCPAPC